MIPGYEEGSDLSLLNVTYRFPTKTEDNTWTKDFVLISYKDNKTGEKKHHIIYEPDYEFYKVKDDLIVDHHLFFVDQDKTEKIVVPYKNLTKKIAEMTGNEEFFYDAIASGNRRALSKLHSINNIMNSDMQIEDHYRYRFNKLYTNEPVPVEKAFFDIEADTIDMRGDFPEMGECPVNAISYINEKNNKITIYLLRNDNNKLIQEFEDSISDNLFKELKEFIIDSVNGEKKASKYGLLDVSFEFRFFDDEIKLIKNFFDTVNEDKPDFLLAWNMAFDVPYLYNRIINLGKNPTDIMSSSNYEQKYADVYIDEFHKDIYEARGDKYVIASDTVYLDQLIHFASRRKGQSKFPNFKLDTAGQIIAGVKKLDYSHITHNIAMLPYLDYKTFVFYNIMDTVVQKCIETETGDIDYIYSKCLYNNTRYEKGHRQTVYLTNRATYEFSKDGLIIGNNNNRNNTKTPFPGALVGDPTHNDDNFKLRKNGEILNIANNLNDYDFKSLYPSITIEHNMAPNTQIGKVIIADKIYDKENPFHNEFYERGGRMLDDICSGNYIEFCKRWFNLPGYRDILREIFIYFTTNQRSFYGIDNKCLDGYIHPVQFINKDLMIEPVKFINKDEMIKPVYKDSKHKDMIPYIRNINY